MSSRTLLFGIAVVVVLILGNMILAYRNAQRVAGTAGRVAHTLEVIAELDDVLDGAIEAESAERGFIITGNDRYLAPFRTAEQSISASVGRLRELTADYQQVAARVPEIERLARGRLDLLRLALAVATERGFDAARTIVLTDQGRALMDSLRREIGAAEADERQLLATRAATYDESRAFALGTTVAGGLLSLLLVAVFGAILQRDMRLRAEAADALLGQKELFRTTLGSIGDAVIATDTKGTVTFMNRVAESLTGATSHDAVGQPLERVFSIVDEHTREPVGNPAVRALHGGGTAELADNTLLIARDGSETPIDDSAAPIRDATGQTRGAVLVFRDITDRRRAERARLDADRHKDEFLAILAHELRNPLAPLRNALELLPHAVRDPTILERVRPMMTRQLEQLVRLTDDLLDVSRITRNELQIRKEPVDLVQVVHGALETCAPLIAQQRHTVVQSIPPAPIIIDGDRTRLTQALYNLIGNAAKYTDPGGTIEIGVAQYDGEAVVRVRDSGVGIDPAMLDRVFELFTQADRSIARSQGGLGIGLTLVKRIIEAHGGAIAVRSAGRGHGSEFVVSLPASAARAAAITPPEYRVEHTPDPTVARRVLVADDNRDAADTTALMLQAAGHSLHTCYSGQQALADAEWFLPDVMLLDIGMPGLSGYELAREVRALPWGREVTLIALTGWGQPEDRMRSVAAGFDHHLVKPVQVRELHEAIHGGRRSSHA